MPFTRKDHFRDHLRDYHKEDIGEVKGLKREKDAKKRLAMEKAWRAERAIKPQWWRCSRCLVKHYITEDGWDCARCKTSCEQERQNARIKLAPKIEVMEPMEEDTDAQYGNTGTSSVTGYNDCEACHNTSWILHGRDWVACQCQWNQ
jgi:hypothetical protein